MWDRSRIHFLPEIPMTLTSWRRTRGTSGWPSAAAPQSYSFAQSTAWRRFPTPSYNKSDCGSNVKCQTRKCTVDILCIFIRCFSCFLLYLLFLTFYSLFIYDINWILLVLVRLHCRPIPTFVPAYPFAKRGIDEQAITIFACLAFTSDPSFHFSTCLQYTVLTYLHWGPAAMRYDLKSLHTNFIQSIQVN